MDIPAATPLALGLVFVVALVPMLPTEPVLISCGVLISAGHLPFLGVLGVAAIGCALSDLVNYSVGRLFGRRALARFEHKATAAAAMSWVSTRLTSHAEPILVMLRWVPAGGTVGAVVSGSLRLPLRRFITASAIGCPLWTLYAIMLGYLGGALTNEDIPLAFLFSLGFAVTISLLVGVFARRLQQKGPKQHRSSTPAPAVEQSPSVVQQPLSALV